MTDTMKQTVGLVLANPTGMTEVVAETSFRLTPFFNRLSYQ